MRWKRITVAALGAFLVAAVSAIGLEAQPTRSEAVPPAFVQWSVDGRLVGEKESAPLRARDFHAGWTTGGALLVWTKNGTVNSGAIESPSGANDFRVVWGRRARKFNAAFWTQNGEDLQPIPIAPGSNGVILRLTSGVFDRAFWSDRNGNPLQPIVPAPGANDVHLELKSSLGTATSDR